MAEEVGTNVAPGLYMDPYASDEIVTSKEPAKEEATTAYESEESPKDASNEIKPIPTSEQPKPNVNESDSSRKEDTTGDYFEKQNSEQKATADDNLQSADYYWDNNQELRNKFELEFPGKGKEKFNEYYQTIADKYFKSVVSYTDDLQLNSVGLGETYYRHGKQVVSDPYSYAPIGGGISIGGEVIGQSRSVREAELKSKNLFTNDGNIVKVEDEWSDVIGNPKYKSKDGRLITALEYVPFDPKDRSEGGLKAVYEGDRSTGETVSVHDMKGWITSNVGMETPWAYVIPKAVVRSTVNTVTSLATSSVDLLNSVATVLDADDDNATITATNNLRNKLKAYEIGTADYDREHMLTFANATNLVADITAQLVLAGGIGKIAGGLSKISQAAGTAAQKWGTLTALSLMGASDIKDEAINAGFSEDAAASLFLAYLPAMAAANSLSEVMINEESAPFIKSEINRLARESLALTTPEALANDASRWAFAKMVANKTSSAIAKLSGNMSQATAGKMAVLGTAAASEATEEVVEQLFGDALKTSANLISKYSSPTDDYPKMVGMYDAEYWEKAPAELLMNAVGGALGGPMGKLMMGHKGIQSLPYQTNDKDKILRLAAEGGENWKLYKESLLRSRDKGLLGTDKYSYKMNADKKFIKMDDLTEQERATHLSIAEANYRLKMMQANLYESVLGGFKGTYDEFVKKNPGLAEQMLDRGAAYDRATQTYKELEDLYKEIAPENYKAAQDTKKGWFQTLDRVNAKVSSVVSKKKTKDRTSEENPQVTTTEVVEKPELTTNELTDARIQEYADKLGVDPIKAKKVLDKEQELEDMLSGKTMERDFVDMVIASDPTAFGVLGATKDQQFADSGKDLIYKLFKADVKKFSEDQKAHGTYLARKSQLSDKVKNLSSINDLEALVTEVNTTDGKMYLDPEDRQLLESKIHTLVADSFTDVDSEIINNHIEDKMNVQSLIDSSSIVERGTEDEESLLFRLQVADDAEREELIDDNLHLLYNYAKGKYLQAFMDKGKTGLFGLLSGELGTNVTRFGEVLKANIKNLDPTDEEPEIFVTNAYTSFNETSPEEEKADIVTLTDDSTDDNKAANNLKEKVSKYTDLVKNAKKQDSEETFDDAGEFFETFMKPLSTKDDDVTVGNDLLTSSISKLFERMQPSVETADESMILGGMLGYQYKDADGNVIKVDIPRGDARQASWRKFYGKALFDATEDARSLLASVKVRQAQLNLLMRLGDPRNELESDVDRLVAAGKVLSTLRKHNAKSQSQEEFNDGVENTKYSVISKVVSGWLFDPELLDKIASAQALSPEETTQRDEMYSVMNDILAAKAVLNQAESDINTLIEIGESSKDEASVANKFKGSIKEYIVGNEVRDSQGRIINQVDSKPGLQRRLAALQIEDPDLDKAISDLTIFAPTVSPDDTEGIKKLYSQIVDVAVALYKLPAEKKAAILSGITTTSDIQRNADILAFMNSDVREFYKHFKNTVDIMSAGGGNVIMPSMEQEIAAIQAFSYATVPSSENLIKKKISSLGGYSKGEATMMFVPGKYGTGKTKVIAGYTAKTIQLFFKENYPSGKHKVLVGGNTSDQIENVAEVAKQFDVVLTPGTSGNGVTKEDLLALFDDEKPDSIDKAYDALKDTSLLIFDEATMIENYEKGSNPTPLLQLIYQSIDAINTRRLTEGLPELTFIGLGDRNQGGWRSGNKTVRGTVIPTDSENVAYNISSNSVVMFNSLPLTVNFRSYVTTIDRFASAALDVNKASMTRSFKESSISEIRTQFGPLISDETGKQGGVQIVNTKADLFSGVATDIRKQIEQDPNFRVLIVDENLTSAEDIHDEELKALVKEYPDAFKLENIAAISPLRVRSIEAAQGAEANYVIINTPTDWLPKITKPEKLGFRYSLISMLAGRARHFVKLRVDDSVNIKSTGPVQIPSIQQSIGEHMGDWSALKREMLQGIKTPEGKSVNRAINTPQYIPGTTVTKNLPDGTEVEEVTIKEISPEGDITIVPSSGIEEVAGNINDPNIAVVLTPSTVVKPEVDEDVKEEAKDARLTAYDTFVKKGGNVSAKFKGEPVKITKFNKGTDAATIQYNNGITEDVKISDVLGKDLTIDKIEGQFASDVAAAVKVNEIKKSDDPETAEKAGDVIEETEQEDDPEPDEAFVEFLAEPETFDPTSDTNESLSMMKDLEKQGVVVAYTDISKQDDKGTLGSSFYFKMHYSNDNFNGHIYTEEELQELTNRATGQYGEAEMGKFNYSLVTYEYYSRVKPGTPQSKYFANVIVAKEKSTDKKFIIGMFSTSKLGDGKFKSFLTQRERALEDISLSYINDSNTDFKGAIPGSVVYEAVNVGRKPEYKQYKIVPADLVDKGKVPLVMETDITSAFLSGNKLLVGTTPGVLVRSSEDIRTIMADTLASTSWDRNAVHAKVVGPKPATPKPVSLGKARVSDTLPKANKALFGNFDGNTVAKYGEYFIVAPNVPNTITLPFITKDGEEFELLYGFTKEGEPITNNLMPDDKQQLMTIVSNYKKALENIGLDTNMKKVTEYTDVKTISRVVANMLKYDLAGFNKAASMVDKFNYGIHAILQLTPTNLSDVNISLADLKKLISYKNGSRSNNRSNLKISKPMVLRQSSKSKSGLAAGRIFVLYSSNGKYDVTNPEVVRSLENELKAYMEDAKRGGIEGAIGKLRGGIGIITLDYPHSSLAQLEAIRKSSPAGKLNRYALPSDSVVGKRLMTMMAELSSHINSLGASLDGNNRLPSEYTRLPKLLKSMKDEKGNQLTVLKPTARTNFIENLKKMILAEDPVASHFLSIVDALTNDKNLGNYVTKMEGGSMADMGHHPYPANKEEGNQYTFVPGASGKPRVFEINSNPMIFIPQEIAAEIGYGGDNQPARFNLESFLDLIHNGGEGSTKPTQAQIDGVIKLFDSLMINHTNGLNKGIKVPPAMMKADKTSLWGTLEESDGISLADTLMTPVKDIRSSALAFNLDNLIAAVEQSATKQSSAPTTLTQTQLKEKINSEFNAAYEQILDSLENNEGVTEQNVQSLLEAARSTLSGIKDKWIASKSVPTNVVNNLFRAIYTKTMADINAKVVQTIYPISTVRKNEFARPDARLKHNFDYNEVNKIFDELVYVVDETSLKTLEERIDSVLASISNKLEKKALKNYFDAVINSLRAPDVRISSQTAIKEVVDLFDQGKIKIAELDITTSDVINSLENILSPETLNPYKKTTILQAYVRGTADERKILQDYLDSSVSNMNEPVIMAYALYDAAIGGYPITEQSKFMVELSQKAPQLLSAVMANPAVQTALSEISGNEDWTNNFGTEINLVVGAPIDVNTKMQYLNALNAVVENLRPILNENVIKQMEEQLANARNQVSKVPTTGNGNDLLSVLESSPFYSALDPTTRKRFGNAITTSQKDLGDKMSVILDVLNGQSVLTDPVVFSQFSTSKALLMDSLFRNLGKEDFKIVGPIITKLFNSVC